MKFNHPSYSLLLPFAALATMATLLLVPAGLTFYRLHQAAHGSDHVTIHNGRFDTTIRVDRLLPFALESVGQSMAHAITAVNMPGFAIEILISLATSWPMVWHPEGLMVDTWRALAYPFFCLPAWWLVGRGLDAAFTRERLHVSLLLAGSFLTVAFVVLCAGLRFGVSASDRMDSNWPLWGLGLWSVAFGVLPAAWLRQEKGKTRGGSNSPESEVWAGKLL